MLSLLLPNDDLREQVYDYIPLLLAEFQGGLEALFVTQVRPDSRTPDPQESAGPAGLTSIPCMALWSGHSR